MDYDKAATAQLLTVLKDGDKSPLEPGDGFWHPEHGQVAVSKVYGWQERHQMVKGKNGLWAFKPVRVLVLSFKKPGQKKANKVSIFPGVASESEAEVKR